MTTRIDEATQLKKPAIASGTFTIGGDLKVNRLGFGAMRITGPGIWGPPKDRASAIALLKYVIELGINFIDTADSYGPNVSEELIAEALYPYPQDLVIATKGGLLRPGAQQWTVNGDPKRLRSACENSLKRLKLDQIDLYQLHRIDPNFPLADQIGTLRDLQNEGKIRHIGLSEVSVAEIEEVQKMVNVVSVQNKYNLLERDSENVLQFCEKQQLGFIPWFPLATGNLAKDSVLSHIASRFDAKPSQIAIAWLLKKSKVMLPIPGTSASGHLEENTKAALIKLDDATMRELDALA